MEQNKNKLIRLFVGNISTAIVHQLLEQAIAEDIHRKHYEKECLHSFSLAKAYRGRIHPYQSPLSEKDQAAVKRKIKRNVTKELQLRIAKGYKGLDLNSIEPAIEAALQKLRVK
ncbi:MAG: hypothetical protein V1743_00960 [Nanoarchaeota archaeon]